MASHCQKIESALVESDFSLSWGTTQKFLTAELQKDSRFSSAKVQILSAYDASNDDLLVKSIQNDWPASKFKKIYKFGVSEDDAPHTL